MKLGTLRDGSRDGCLLVVSRDLKYAVRAAGIAPTLLGALESWETVAPELHKLSALLNTGAVAGAFELDVRQLAAPLPRTWAWLDGSAFHSHEIVDRSDNPGGSCTIRVIVDLVNSTLVDGAATRSTCRAMHRPKRSLCHMGGLIRAGW